ncbi:MAG: agmatine deiminase family protein, partial [Pseudomonadales bacterium]|nr:agmatine deiminase family protein [Pseudomonadales bacterium]
CFVRPGEVALAWTDDAADPQYARSAAAREVLESATDAKGRSLKVHLVPLPKPMHATEEEVSTIDVSGVAAPREAGTRLAASYINFYLCNRGLIVPSFDDPADQAAQQTLAALFPDRELVAVPGREILLGGGNIHCITQQQPTGSE